MINCPDACLDLCHRCRNNLRRIIGLGIFDVPSYVSSIFGRKQKIGVSVLFKEFYRLCSAIFRVPFPRFTHKRTTSPIQIPETPIFRVIIRCPIVWESAEFLITFWQPRNRHSFLTTGCEASIPKEIAYSKTTESSIPISISSKLPGVLYQYDRGVTVIIPAVYPVNIFDRFISLRVWILGVKFCNAIAHLHNIILGAPVGPIPLSIPGSNQC